MKYSNSNPIENLKAVLSHLREPEQLNEHPWALNLPASDGSNPGARLTALVTATFRKMIPPGPPRPGKRMDTRWGVFGILAAQHFAPAILGTLPPTSQREAWESLDRSILFFVFGKLDGLPPQDVARYRFAGNETEPAPNSTLSDWYRKGLEQLGEMVVLELKSGTGESKATHPTRKPRRTGRIIGLVFLILLMLFITAAGFLGWKAWGFYQRALVIKQKTEQLSTYLNPTPSLAQLPEITTQLHSLRIDMDTLQSDLSPYIWLAPYGDWLPRVGGDISQAPDLLLLAQNLVTAGDEGLNAITPAIKTTVDNKQKLDIMALLMQMQNASPQLLNAQIALANAQAARNRINTDRLSSSIAYLVTGKIDKLFKLVTGTLPMDDALTMVRIAPKLLGSDKAGPQTYMLLIQNEDELRATGGLITAAGTAVVSNGKLLSMRIETSGLLDDYSKPYPMPPWQYHEFMNIDKLVFRDSNWYTDFPRSASMAEYLYSYTRAASSNGIIAIDYHAVVEFLKILGPINVERADRPVTSDNVLDFMRNSKEAQPAGFVGVWDPKQFIGRIAQPLLEKLLQSRGETWTKLMAVMIQLLNEKHIILQFDDEEATKLLQSRNWDGAVRIPTSSDYLMAVDSNMGYNKSNAVMKMALKYSVDLNDMAAPKGILAVQQSNLSKIIFPCDPIEFRRYVPANKVPVSIYNMDECHWGYLRIYVPQGSKLLRSTPHAIPDIETMLGKSIPARTDDIGDEDIPNAQVYGAMVITPTQKSVSTEFEYQLPVSILTQGTDKNVWIYRLKIQKQPGTVANPYTLNLRLPDGAQIESSTIQLAEINGMFSAQLKLNVDTTIEIHFRLK